MSRRTKVVFALTAVLGVLAVSVGILLAVDVYLHSRVQNTGFVNVWGYRGPAVGRKRPGETRIVVVGGSTAFGYGLPWDEAFPHYLEQMLNARATGSAFSVVNLGAPKQGALGFRADLADYAYLQYDAAILYEGYNDLGRTDLPIAAPAQHYATATNDLLWRRESPIFRATGYLPALPLVFREKAMEMMAGGDLDAAYRGQAVFRPGLATRATAGALTTAAAVADSVGATIGHVTGDPANAEKSLPLDTVTWRHYTDRVVDAVRFARSRSVKVVVVTQPYVSDSHIAQQRALARVIDEAFHDDPGVRYVNLGTAVDLSDSAVAYDGLHLVAKGNERIATLLVDPVLQLVRPS